MCLAQSSGQKPTAQLMELQNQAPAVAGYVRQLLTQHPGDSGPVHTYVSMLRQLLTAVSGTWQGCVLFFFMSVWKVQYGRNCLEGSLPSSESR